MVGEKSVCSPRRRHTRERPRRRSRWPRHARGRHRPCGGDEEVDLLVPGTACAARSNPGAAGPPKWRALAAHRYELVRRHADVVLERRAAMPARRRAFWRPGDDVRYAVCGAGSSPCARRRQVGRVRRRRPAARPVSAAEFTSSSVCLPASGPGAGFQQRHAAAVAATGRSELQAEVVVDDQRRVVAEAFAEVDVLAPGLWRRLPAWQGDSPGATRRSSPRPGRGCSTRCTGPDAGSAGERRRRAVERASATRVPRAGSRCSSGCCASCAGRSPGAMFTSPTRMNSSAASRCKCGAISARKRSFACWRSSPLDPLGQLTIESLRRAVSKRARDPAPLGVELGVARCR